MNGLGAFFFGIRWQDIVDILINSYILFRLYVLFKGTTTFRVMVGIAFLWFFQRSAAALGLVMTSWNIQGITAAGALIVVVVFRNEIRSVFQTTSYKSILWGFPGTFPDTPVEIIVQSIFSLASKRVGALMVIPGKDSLDDLLQEGIPWQGIISREMLHSIFWVGNPVHDGAAIIKGKRVSSVGVILPLSKRDDLPLHYGTRHRAAAGLAEKSDAMILLASEERGEVVAAKGRQLMVMRDAAELEKILYDHLGKPVEIDETQKNQKRQLLLAGALSVVLITGIWYGITRGFETLMAMEVPIEYTKSDASLDISETSVNTVKLQLSGSSFLLKSIRPEQVRVRASINSSHVGKSRIPITMEDVTLPPGIMLNKVEPPFVEVVIAKPTLKVLPVQVDWDGKMAEDLIMTDVKLVPQEVPVSGKNDLLEDVYTVYTKKVPLGAITRSGRMTVDLVLDNPSLNLTPDAKKVTIHYVVQKRTNASVFHDEKE
jgi:diadenylate cyclase